MNKDEFSLFAKGMKTYYPRENLLPNMESMELWYRQLKDLDYNDACLALGKYVALNKFAPTIADIRECVSTVVNEDIQDWGASWESVLKKISYYRDIS